MNMPEAMWKSPAYNSRGVRKTVSKSAKIFSTTTTIRLPLTSSPLSSLASLPPLYLHALSAFFPVA